MKTLDSALATVKKYNLIKQNSAIVIGLSGGADSVTLFHFLVSLIPSYNLRLIAVHVNHGIRGDEAQRDMDFAEDLCQKNSVPLEKFYYNIPLKAKELFLTEEEAGRIMRYKAFNYTLEKYNADLIAVAHNMNDNAETILMRLCRGTGIKGLGGINVSRDNIIRPLLYTTRAEIENYCSENNFDYITDSTNTDEAYTRNKIRLSLIPWIQENLNKSIIQSLCVSSDMIAEENTYLDKIAAEELKKASLSSSAVLLDISYLKSLESVILRRVLRLACLSCSDTLYDIAIKHIAAIAELLYKPTGKSVSLPNNLTAEVQYDKLCIYKNSDNAGEFCCPISKNDVLYIKEIKKYVTLSESKISSLKNLKNTYTLSLNCDKIKADLVIRSRKSGDKIFLKGINGYKKLKDLFIDLKIPRSQRHLVPVLAADNEVIAVIGYRFSDLYKVCDKANDIIYIQLWEE